MSSGGRPHCTPPCGRCPRSPPTGPRGSPHRRLALLATTSLMAPAVLAGKACGTSQSTWPRSSLGRWYCSCWSCYGWPDWWPGRDCRMGRPGRSGAAGRQGRPRAVRSQARRPRPDHRRSLPVGSPPRHAGHQPARAGDSPTGNADRHQDPLRFELPLRGPRAPTIQIPWIAPRGAGS
jgi:hypothetical protein